MKDIRIWALAGLLTLPAGGAAGANWPQWRGPHFNGSTEETGLPARWDPKTGEHILWSLPMPGQAGSTPIVWNDRIFLTSADDERNLVLLSVDRKAGKVLWSQVVAVGDRKTSMGNNMASPSPVTDGERVIVTFGTGDVACYDFEGRQLWARSLAREHGRIANMWLYGSSPLLYRGKLYLQVLQRNPVPSDYSHALDGRNERESFLLCIDPKTGKDLWRHVRPTDAIVESQEAYSTPYPHEGPDGAQIIIVGGDYVTAHDPETGAERWRCGGLNAKKDQWWRIITSPVGGAGLVFAAAPKREPLLAVRPGGKGLVTDTHVAWRFTEFPPDVCTPLFYKDRLFVLDGDKRMLTCLEPQSGRELWRGEIPVREVFRSSPTGADGKIYFISDRGTVVVASAGEKFELLSVIPMEEKHDHSSIVAAHGQLLIRTSRHLHCIAGK